MNKFPADDEGDFSEIRAAVEEIQALLKNRAPLTEVSKGWVMRSMDSPDTGPLGPDDIHIYPSGGKLWVASQGSDIALGEVSFGSSVPLVPTMDSGTIAGSPTMAQYNNLYNDARAIRDTVNALLGVLRGGQFPS